MSLWYVSHNLPSSIFWADSIFLAFFEIVNMMAILALIACPNVRSMQLKLIRKNFNLIEISCRTSWVGVTGERLRLTLNTPEIHAHDGSETLINRSHIRLVGLVGIKSLLSNITKQRRCGSWWHYVKNGHDRRFRWGSWELPLWVYLSDDFWLWVELKIEHRR